MDMEGLMHATQLIAVSDDIDIDLMPTQITDAIKPVQPMAKVTKPMLPLDAQNRPYVVMADFTQATQDLIEEAVKGFYEIQHVYPTVICLSAFRYLTYGMQTRLYQPTEKGVNPIPLIYEGYFGDLIDYDVLARGEKEFDGN
jgi:hypothetical protein